MASLDAIKAAIEVYKALDDKKGNKITVIDISAISTLADYFIIADGANLPQVEALVDNVKEKMHAIGRESRRVEGVRNCGWVLLDYEDIVVHVFTTQDRSFYDLERVWCDGKKVSLEELELLTA